MVGGPLSLIMLCHSGPVTDPPNSQSSGVKVGVKSRKVEVKVRVNIGQIFAVFSFFGVFRQDKTDHKD